MEGSTSASKQKTMFFFAQQMEKNQNQCCFDCDAQKPNWVSINNGIFLCLNCSVIHRQLGAQISMVRSVTLDVWNDNLLKMVELGGNQRLNEFFDGYDLNSEDIKIKYTTKAAYYYRRLLHSEVQKTGLKEEKPNFNDGRMLYSDDVKEQLKMPTHNLQNSYDSGLLEQVRSEIKSATVEENIVIQNRDPSIEEEAKEPFSKALQDDDQVDPMEQFTSDFKKRASSILDKSKEYYAQASQSDLAEKTGEAFKRAGTVTKETGAKVKEKLDDMGVSDAASNAVDKVSTNTKMLGGLIYTKAKDASEQFNNNETVAQAKEVTKEKFESFKTVVASGWRSFYSNVVKYDREDEEDGEEARPDVEQDRML